MLFHNLEFVFIFAKDRIFLLASRLNTLTNKSHKLRLYTHYHRNGKN